MNNDSQNYAGKRALVLLRVSTEEQERMFGFPSQLKQIREKLIEPLRLQVDEERHIIRDTYTGLAFRERAELQRILEMAENHEFELVVTDKLDRLGRKGLQREIYRAQLRERGVRILTTDPNEHADDDSLIGEMIRLLHGYKAEEELNDIRRRTMNGKREKAEGNPEKGIAPKHVGHGRATYGYSWTFSEKHKRDGYILNFEIVKVDEDGTEWTEVKVVKFIFESIIEGRSLKQITNTLNAKGIPGPKSVRRSTAASEQGTHPPKTPIWRYTTVSRMARNTAYTGELELFRARVTKVPGKKSPIREPRPAEERVKVAIPQIIDKDLFEKVQEKLKNNQQFSARNNHSPEDSLLRGGLARCGYCGKAMRVQHGLDSGKWEIVRYVCSAGSGYIEKPLQCPMKGCSISVHSVDTAAWAKAIEIIRDPKEVDEMVNSLRSKDPTADHRKHINNELRKIRDPQAAMRANLANLMMQNQPDQGTIEYLNAQLHQLATQESKWQGELAKLQDDHQVWKQVEKKLDEIHEECNRMREKLDDPTYTPSYKEKRDKCIFFGIHAIVRRHDHRPRFNIQLSPPSIMSLLS